VKSIEDNDVGSIDGLVIDVKVFILEIVSIRLFRFPFDLQKFALRVSQRFLLSK